MAGLVVLDVDGTLTKVRSSWQYLHEKLDIWQGKAEYYQESFRRGEISYREFCILDGRLWEGVEVEKVKQIIGEIPYREGIYDFFTTLSNNNRKFALVSTGLSFLVEKVKAEFNLDFAFSNHLLDDGKYLTGMVSVEVDWDDKGEIVRSLKRELGVLKEEVAVFGDSDGDIGMFDAGGFCIAVEPTSEVLRKKAHLVLENGDLERGARHLINLEKSRCTET